MTLKIDGIEEVAPDTGNTVTEQPEKTGGGSGRSTLRADLEKQFENARKAETVPERGERGRFTKGHKLGEGAKDEESTESLSGKPGDETGTVAAGTEGGSPPLEEKPAEGAEVAPEKPEDKVAAPAAWAKDAKAEWDKLPKNVQAAVLKREQDVQKGVDELKGKYADIDAAINPHSEAIRRHGHTNAQAVSQLFNWFAALAANPDAAFPALAKSFNIDLRKYAPALVQNPAPAAVNGTNPPAQVQPAANGDGTQVAAQAAAAQAGGIPPELTQYIQGLEQKIAQLGSAFQQKIGSVESTFAAQNQEKTQQLLSTWSNGKSHFEKVRGLMAQLIQSGTVPLKNGQVDLDGAYNKAIWMDDDTRAELQAAEVVRIAAEQKKQAEAAKAAQAAAVVQARKAAGGGIFPSAPGNGAAIGGGKQKKGISVRDSLKAAIDEVNA